MSAANYGNDTADYGNDSTDHFNDTSRYNDDNNCSEEPAQDSSEQDISVPDFSEQDYAELQNLDGNNTNQTEELDNSNVQTNGHDSKIRNRQRGYNQDGWQSYRSYEIGPSATRYAWGMGYGPSGPYNTSRPGNNRIIRYLMGCGIPREQLMNLPRDLLLVMEPEQCGICNIPLESYQESRAHYLSNGHFRRQNKWRNHQSEVGYSRPKKEHTLKPRESYCELCNVQITSKVHADSHYAGKPHRAIVDGRKQPKNTQLLNKNMRHRLDLLIAREKKCFSELKEVPKEVVPPKPIQPELYCEICKTSVTCTEQMTCHLNGKRHLAKEKQHILKMMKGETDDKQDKGEGDAKDDGKDNADSEESDQDLDDWGNGSGVAWDDPQ